MMVPRAVKVFFLYLIALSTSGLVEALKPNDTKLVFYYGPEFTDSVSYDLSEATKVLQHPKFTNNETHCYLHGYHETQNSESIHLIVDSYMKRKNINLLTIDWAEGARENYLAAALKNVRAIAPQLADMILGLYAAGLKRESFTVVAHSLGGQLSGLTGREIAKKTNGTEQIYELVVLDPAYPLFFNVLSLKTVHKKDAEFVQAIHTDIGTYGQPASIGHVDFWPNGGLQGQPGCPTGFLIPFSKEDLCSHQRSWRFWAESIANVDGPEFWAFPASNYMKFLSEDIEKLKDKAIPMGYHCPRDARGNYYLKTNKETPFAKGFEGY